MNFYSEKMSLCVCRLIVKILNGMNDFRNEGVGEKLFKHN